MTTTYLTFTDALLRLFEIGDIQAADVEGVVRCYCGCKYWENDSYSVNWTENGVRTEHLRNIIKCIDCGQTLNAELITKGA